MEEFAYEDAPLPIAAGQTISQPYIVALMIEAAQIKPGGFQSLRETAIDTTTVHGRLTLSILAAIAEFERELIQARVSEGRKRAVAAGVKFGPKFKLTGFQRQEALARLDNARPERGRPHL